MKGILAALLIVIAIAGGGYALGKAAQDITIADVIQAVEAWDGKGCLVVNMAPQPAGTPSA